MGSEEWREMKIMVLGHGRIGKTTLVHAIHALKTNLQTKSIPTSVPIPVQVPKSKPKLTGPAHDPLVVKSGKSLFSGTKKSTQMVSHPDTPLFIM